MGDTRPHSPVLLLLAAFSRYDDALAWTRQQAVDGGRTEGLGRKIKAKD